MALTRNNLVVYHAPLTTIGDVNGVLSAIGILSKFDGAIIKPHTGSDLTNLSKIVLGLKAIKPAFKLFGYTDLGGSADYDTWEATVDQWIADLGTNLSGIFIDKFGYDYAPLVTRTVQNTAVDKCHLASLPVFVSATSTLDVLGKLGAEADPALGRSTTLRDYILLDSFFFVNSNAASPSVEGKEQLHGRLEFVKGAKLKTDGTSYNLGVAGSVGAGTGSTISTDGYDAALLTANNYSMDFLAVTPYDLGLTAHKYFYKYRSNTFSDA